MLLVSAVIVVSCCSSIVAAQGRSDANKGRIFTIAITHDWGAYEYLDQAGYIQGFSKDLVREVCREAGIDCRTVWDKGSNCWNSEAGQHSTGGKGLMSKWYDACMGWNKSVNRIQTFAFGAPYLKQKSTHFYVKAGTDFDAKDITGKKIGFIDGYVFDEKCVARQTDIKGSELPLNQIFRYSDFPAALDALLAGTVDALTGDDDDFSRHLENGDVEKKAEFYCTLAGPTLMARKDNDLLPLWDAGFAKLQNSGQFNKICDQAEKDHGHRGEIDCV